MQNNNFNDLLDLFDNLLTCDFKDSQNIQKIIISKIDELKIDLKSNKLDKEDILQLSKTIDKLIKSKELKHKKDFIIFEEFKNYLEKKT